MSFSNNCKSDKIPGPLKNNPINGLCEKVCIQCDKVLDMCMRQEVLTDVTVNISNITPTDLVPPYKFLSARAVETDAEISNLVITDMQDGSCNSRVSGTVLIPIQVIFLDANNNQGVGYASISVPRDVVLHTSAPSVMPYRIVANAAAVASRGTYISDNTFSISLCSTVILKVLMQVQLLLPSYGYSYIPPCMEYNEDVCEGVFDIPLYPQDCGYEPRCGSTSK